MVKSLGEEVSMAKAKLPVLTEAEIQQRIASDPDAPEATDEQLAQARPFIEAFLELAGSIEDAQDAAAVVEFRRKLAAGEEEQIPSEIVDRILAGENKVRVWREHRGLSAGDLAEKAALSPAYLRQIETGTCAGTIDVMTRIAKALSITLDDLA
jgi:ribosome-binding protein aMBF1 (putative translation factor)